MFRPLERETEAHWALRRMAVLGGYGNVLTAQDRGEVSDTGVRPARRVAEAAADMRKGAAGDVALSAGDAGLQSARGIIMAAADAGGFAGGGIVFSAADGSELTDRLADISSGDGGEFAAGEATKAADNRRLIARRFVVLP